jgi:integrase
LPKPFEKKRPKAGRTVRKRLADGTVREYHYPAWKAPAKPAEGDTIRALLRAYQASPDWLSKADRTRQQYLIYLRPWLKVEDSLVSSIRRRDIIAARDAMAETRGPGAANAFTRTASALFRFALERDWIEHNPVTGIRALPGGSLPAWSEAQISAALAGLREDLRRVVVLGLHTGQRRGDLIAMTWAAYDGATIRLRQAKTGAALILPVHPELRAELEKWKAERASVQILTSPRAGAWASGEHLSHEMARALRDLGLPAGLNIHGLRKAAARRLAEAGCTVHEIASITGHRSLAMVQHYTSSADQQRLAGAAVERLTTKIQPNKKTK